MTVNELNEVLKDKVDIVTDRPQFLLEWSKGQWFKVERNLVRLFNMKILTDHRGNKSKMYGLKSLENFFGLPYTSSSSFALMAADTNTMWYVDNDKKYKFDYVAMDKDEKVYMVAMDSEENEIYLKVR